MVPATTSSSSRPALCSFLDYAVGFLCSHLTSVKAPLGLPSGSDGKEFACNAGDSGLIPGWGRSPGGGNGNPLQYSGLENSMDRGAWQTIVHGVAKSQT